MIMVKVNKTVFLLLLVSFFVGCNNEKAPYKKGLCIKVEPLQIEVMRYDKAFFEADTADFANAMKELSADYAPFFRGGDLNDPEALRYLRDFAIDPFARILYQKMQEKYPTDESVAMLLEKVMARINHYYPDKKLNGKVYTCVWGLDLYNPPVHFDNGDIIISLDYYLDNDEVYPRVGIPQYRSLRTYSDFMARDLAFGYYNAYLRNDSEQGSLLDEMVKEGKMLFFAEAVNPEMPDTVLMGYTAKQLEWLKEAEGDIWRDIVGKSYLYSSQRELFMMMLNDGPFTQQYSYDAPSRIGEYIGLQIIRSYMSRNNVSLQELIANNDLQGIFNESGYRPKRE